MPPPIDTNGMSTTGMSARASISSVHQSVRSRSSLRSPCVPGRSGAPGTGMVSSRMAALPRPARRVVLGVSASGVRALRAGDPIGWRVRGIRPRSRAIAAPAVRDVAWSREQTRTTARTSTRPPVRLRPLHRRARSARPAGRHPRGAGRDRPGRHGGLLAAHGAAGAAAARDGGAARPRRADPRDLAPPVAAAAGEPARRHPRRRSASCCARRWRPSATRSPATTATTPASARCSSTRCRRHRRSRARAQRVRLALLGRPRGLRGDPRPARPGDARPALPGHEAGDGERDAAGRRADQGDARRPQLPARQPRGGPGHHRSSSTSSWPSTASSSRRARRTPRSWSICSPPGPPRPSGCSTR